MRRQSIWPGIVPAVFLAGCGMLMTQPETLEDKVELARSQVAKSYEIIGDMAKAKQINRDQGTRLLRVANTANEAVYAADLALSSGDTSTPVGIIKMIQTILIELQAILVERASVTDQKLDKLERVVARERVNELR